MTILPLLPCGCMLSMMIIVATHGRKITITSMTLWPHVEREDNSG